MGDLFESFGVLYQVAYHEGGYLLHANHWWIYSSHIVRGNWYPGSTANATHVVTNVNTTTNTITIEGIEE